MKTAPKKRTPLSADLEKALLYGILRGLVSLDSVDGSELSKFGSLVHRAAAGLSSGGGSVSPETVLLYATDVLGASKDAVKAYLHSIQTENVGKDAPTILQAVRDKQTLVELINEAGAQLQKGTLDVALLGGLLTSDDRTHRNLESVAERVKDGLPDPPAGLSLASLPVLSTATRGLIGMWAIAGEPGVGKSTLAWQLGLDIGRHTPVLYYDFENGFAVLMDRTRELFKGNLDKIKAATSKLFVRDSIRTLDTDLACVSAPALVVVDSIQKLPSAGDNRRQGLDRWVHRLEALKKRGYYVLLVSEVARSQYQQEAYIGSFKETGEIEYSADAGIQLLPISEGVVELNIVKNRHAPHKGMVCTIERKNGWWWREHGGYAAPSSPPEERVLD